MFVTWHTDGNAEYDSVVFAALIPTKAWLCQGKPDILNETALHTLHGTRDPAFVLRFPSKTQLLPDRAD